jgi:biopolymer transport protein ExbD
MIRRRKKKKREQVILELNMTAMCDVVFQLLIYLILTAKPMDVLAHLDVNRPTPDPNAPKMEKPQDLVEIAVFADGYQFNSKPIGLKSLDGFLAKLSALSKTQTILIKCAPDAPHERLIKILDLCGQYGLTSLSVLSL